MKLFNKRTLYICILAFIIIASGCTKNALDKKSDIRLAVPTTLDDFQGLLDGLGNYNTDLPCYRSMGAYLSDDVYLTDANYTSFNSSQVVQLLYTWTKQPFSTITSLSEWDAAYTNILNCNIVLEGVAKISRTPGDSLQWDNIYGSALLIRALMFSTLANYWAPPYDSATANTDLGIVLKLKSDINEKIARSNVADSYNQIISDLKMAASMLTNTSTANTPVSKVRPSKAAAYGLLARVYLTMQDYKDVKLYADSCLQLYSSLMDYNQISSFTDYNDEIIYDACDNGGTTCLNNGNYDYYYYNIDTTLLHSYETNDLRSTLFFYNSNGAYVWDGDYTSYHVFTGLATDEVYLMRAEAEARLGDADDAMKDLNTLLVTRWKTGTYTNMTASSADDALSKILTERRKELVLRGTRWEDLRRLNKDSRFAKTLTRIVNGTTYTLPPNDPRYTMQIPEYIIQYNGIQQNP